MEEINEEEDELHSDLWNTLLVDDDDSGLTEAEEKEVLKLHTYFAHQSGQKLCENLFQPTENWMERKGSS